MFRMAVDSNVLSLSVFGGNLGKEKIQVFHWNAGIYMDEKVKKKPQKYRRLVKKRKLVRGCYCITLPANEKNCMDIYSSREFWFQHYRKQNIEIIGLAADREGAMEILCQMASDITEAFGEMNAKNVRAHFCFGNAGENKNGCE